MQVLHLCIVALCLLSLLDDSVASRSKKRKQRPNRRHRADDKERSKGRGRPSRYSDDSQPRLSYRFLPSGGDSSSVVHNDFDPSGCKQTSDERKMLRCPSDFDTAVCISDNQLCNGKRDCPHGQDEDAQLCMFHKNTMHYIEILIDMIQTANRDSANKQEAAKKSDTKPTHRFRRSLRQYLLPRQLLPHL